MIKQVIKSRKGITFVELLLYIAIFFIITPVLLMVSINSAQRERTHVVEKQVNIDSQFVVERIYDLIAEAKKVDTANSLFEESEGKLTLVMQDDSSVIIEMNVANKTIEITEDGVKTELSAGSTDVQSLYFERITDSLNDPEIVLGINVRLNITGEAEHDQVQNYVTSANLERGDYDEDGCADYLDKFPRHAECCGDGDDDGICDELDNCVLTYNPFQEDFDTDEIGDECDDNVYLGEGGDGGGGGLGAFNCSPDNQLLDLLHEQPPIPPGQLKQILMSSSPLPPTVLNELILTHPLITNGQFRQVFIANVRLSDEVYDNLMAAPNVSGFNKFIIGAAHFLAQYIPWLGSSVDESDYTVEHNVNQCGEDFYTNSIRFHSSTAPLGSADLGQLADVFIVNVNNGGTTVTVTTTTSVGSETYTLDGGGSTVIDSLGFQTTLESITGNNYAFTVISSGNEDELESVEFNFGCGATVVSPTDTYTSQRYVCYCEGGCDEDCGDIGTGILTSHVYTDRCYKWDWFYPEWCSRWYTFEDNDTENPAFLGGTSAGEETAYWEKSFKTILTQNQLSNLASITVGGEVAYQSTTQFFCDTLSSSCVMEGVLVGAQNIELYNWDNSTWEVVEEMGLNGAISDQQKYEVKYASGSDILKYVGGSDNREIKVRMMFHWNGIIPQGQSSAPSFMAIDYFTIHLKW